jgi:hypothetical protein
VGPQTAPILRGLGCNCVPLGRRSSLDEITETVPSRNASHAPFSGYNRSVYGITQHILVRNAHAQAISRLLGGFSCLPASLPGRTAIARPRQPFRRRLTFPYVLTLSSA